MPRKTAKAIPLPHLLLLCLFLSLPGCGGISYVCHLGWHQGFILYHSQPLTDVLQDEGIDPALKAKILFIQEVKRFGEERLGLRRTKNYSTLLETAGPVLFFVTASEKDRLELRSWSFPIIGKVTYKGFFSYKEALKEKRRLENEGLDTFVQAAAAYSTLGWFKDPIFSSMLEWEASTLANVIFHEMAHATLYVKGQTPFNEQFATFVGNRGTIDFLREKYGPTSAELRRALEEQEDDLLFSRWIGGACERLSNFYRQEIPTEQKRKGREEIFRSLKEDFRKTRSRFKTDCYPDLEKMELNNAVVLAFRRYFEKLDRFEALYENLGHDLRRVIDYFQNLRTNGTEADWAPWIKEDGRKDS